MPEALRGTPGRFQIGIYCNIGRSMDVPDNWVHQCSETFPKGFMVVGVMTGRGVLPIIKVPSKVKVNSEFYIECVLKPVIEQLKDLYPGEMDKVFLHHDKASSHTSNKTQQFLQEMKDTLGLNFIRNSDIPVKSPDASPLDFYGFVLCPWYTSGVFQALRTGESDRGTEASGGGAEADGVTGTLVDASEVLCPWYTSGVFQALRTGESDRGTEASAGGAEADGVNGTWADASGVYPGAHTKIGNWKNLTYCYRHKINIEILLENTGNGRVQITKIMLEQTERSTSNVKKLYRIIQNR
ncbi:hypothetical protein LAZ67_16001288 [Cordylochernes scorpioides]|uniref:Transposase n=1 Tax=Cordylochernes scorpioides TaxID=51811 RepID=A0ABY6LB91_9ARAC|nr:hypothetical protein LAZ67_16001288 [Cordylochernes scorpioides]